MQFNYPFRDLPQIVRSAVKLQKDQGSRLDTSQNNQVTAEKQATTQISSN